VHSLRFAQAVEIPSTAHLPPPHRRIRSSSLYLAYGGGRGYLANCSSLLSTLETIICHFCPPFVLSGGEHGFFSQVSDDVQTRSMSSTVYCRKLQYYATLRHSIYTQAIQSIPSSHADAGCAIQQSPTCLLWHLAALVALHIYINRIRKKHGRRISQLQISENGRGGIGKTHGARLVCFSCSAWLGRSLVDGRSM